MNSPTPSKLTLRLRGSLSELLKAVRRASPDQFDLFGGSAESSASRPAKQPERGPQRPTTRSPMADHPGLFDAFASTPQPSTPSAPRKSKPLSGALKLPHLPNLFHQPVANRKGTYHYEKRGENLARVPGQRIEPVKPTKPQKPSFAHTLDHLGGLFDAPEQTKVHDAPESYKEPEGQVTMGGWKFPEEVAERARIWAAGIPLKNYQKELSKISRELTLYQGGRWRDENDPIVISGRKMTRELGAKAAALEERKKLSDKAASTPAEEPYTQESALASGVYSAKPEKPMFKKPEPAAPAEPAASTPDAVAHFPDAVQQAIEAVTNGTLERRRFAEQYARYYQDYLKGGAVTDPPKSDLGMMSEAAIEKRIQEAFDKAADQSPRFGRSTPEASTPEASTPEASTPDPDDARDKIRVDEDHHYENGKRVRGKTPEEIKAVGSAKLADWVEQKLQKGQAITSADLFRAGDAAFGGTQANGAHNAKDCYDAVEMAVNRRIATIAAFDPSRGASSAENAITSLKSLLSLLPTQARRTAESDEFQQFSTVPPLAYVANWVANLSPDDVVLEPSAGVGGLAAFAKNAGAEVIANELSTRRKALLEQDGLFDHVYGENAEQIDNVLPDHHKPTVVVMNPPFSSTAGRMQGVRDTTNATKHIEQALARLEPGGRLVAIVGNGMDHGRPSFAAWWRKMEGQFDVRANIQVSGSEYAKYGTTWDNQILVIDKPRAGEVSAGQSPRTGRVEKVEDLIPLLSGIREQRNEHQPGDTSLAGQQRQGAGESAGGTVQPNDGANARGALESRGGGIAGAGQQGMGEPDLSGNRSTGSGQAGAGLDERQSASDQSSVDQAGSTPDDGRDKISVQDAHHYENGKRVRGEGMEDAAADGHRVVVDHVDEATHGALTDAVFDSYAPRIRVKGTTMPPIEVQESSAMASVDPIQPTYQPAIPEKYYLPQNGAEEGRLSALAMESIILAGNAHQTMIPLDYTDQERKDFRANNNEEPPSQARRGFFIGDGTGLGKGRQVAGIILDNWTQGRKKAIWISEKPALFNDAKRDLNDVADMGAHAFEVSKVKMGDEISHQQGVAFVSYATLRSSEKNPREGTKAKSRVDQIVNWFGKDFDGVIAFDESHALANNSVTKGKRGNTTPSQQAMVGMELQRRLPNARIVYLSATGATEVSNLGYAERLGVWGPGTPFPNKESFVQEVTAGGVAAMELVARDLKAQGSYLARAISWNGVGYSKIEHELTPQQRETYDTLALGWQTALQNMHEALKVVGAVTENAETGKDKVTNPAAKSAMLSAFWGAHQRFFNQVITSMKMPTVLAESEQAVKNGKAVVMQLVNTNEAAQNRAIDNRRNEAADNQEAVDLEDLDLTPRDILMQMIEHSFPVTQQEEYTDEEGNSKMRVAVDANGSPIINKQAVKMRDALLDKLGSMAVPDGPLEMIHNHFGHENVAEVTGRTQRVIWGKDADGNRKRVIEKRSKAHGIREAEEFQNDKRKVLVFSNAGGTGRSYHADKKAANQRTRYHVLVQPGWQAAQAIQGFGRTHRNNQKQPPEYALATSNVVGEARFISSIARRLDQLGALTKGSRQTASNGFFKSRDNLESDEAKAALTGFYKDVVNQRIPGLSPSVLEQEMGMKLRDSEGNLLESLPPITQFLNRLLSLRLDTQNQVFDAFSERLDRVIESKIASGTLDQGMENLDALSTKEMHNQVVHTDERTGAQTRYVKLQLTHKNERHSFPAGQMSADGTGPKFVRNRRSGKIYHVGNLLHATDTKTGEVVAQHKLKGASGTHQWVPQHLVQRENDRWEQVPHEKAQELWQEQYDAAPETRTEDVHFISGTILPVWDRIKTGDDALQVRRAQTDDGKRMIGMVVHPKDLPRVLQNFGLDEGGEKTKTFTPDQALESINDGKTARLANGWSIRNRRVGGEDRLELSGPDYSHQAELETAGIFSERIQFKTRYFIPRNKAPEIIAKLTASRPITELGGGQTPDALTKAVSGNVCAGSTPGAPYPFGRSAFKPPPARLVLRVRDHVTAQALSDLRRWQ